MYGGLANAIGCGSYVDCGVPGGAIGGGACLNAFIGGALNVFIDGTGDTANERLPLASPDDETPAQCRAVVTLTPAQLGTHHCSDSTLDSTNRVRCARSSSPPVHPCYPSAAADRSE